MAKIKRGNHDRHLPRIYSPDLKRILSRLLTVDPRSRPTAAELLEDPYFAAEVKRNDAYKDSGGKEMTAQMVADPLESRSSKPDILVINDAGVSFCGGSGGGASLCFFLSFSFLFFFFSSFLSPSRCGAAAITPLLALTPSSFCPRTSLLLPSHQHAESSQRAQQGRADPWRKKRPSQDAAGGLNSGGSGPTYAAQHQAGLNAPSVPPAHKRDHLHRNVLSVSPAVTPSGTPRSSPQLPQRAPLRAAQQAAAGRRNSPLLGRRNSPLLARARDSPSAPSSGGANGRALPVIGRNQPYKRHGRWG